MLLSLYAINNRWIRNAVTILFKRLIPLLTPNSVKLIIDLLEPESEEDLIMENDDDDDDDNEGEVNDESMFIAYLLVSKSLQN